MPVQLLTSMSAQFRRVYFIIFSAFFLQSANPQASYFFPLS